jgi:soluble lytic murein transglycosylase-like protein
VATVTDLITAEAQRQGVDPGLAIEVARAESNLDPNTPDSSAGAIGLFQLEPATAAMLGVNPRDMNQNITGGIRYIGQLLGQFGSIPAALAAYNWGPGNVSRALAQYGAVWVNHLPSETAAYVSTIMRNLAQYSASVTPASIANGVTQLLTPSSDQAAAGPSSSAVGPIVILTALAVGAYIVAEVFLE